MADQPQQPTPSDDPFDPLLSLEEQYHTEGRALGLADGERTGRIEGRVFGLEKSFEKFLEFGQLGGRAGVWGARLPDSDSAGNGNAASYASGPHASGPRSSALEVGKEGAGLGVLPGSGSERLVRHVRRLVELTDADDVSRENSEEGVQDFDDRVREAKAKAVLIERLVGEGKESGGSGNGGPAVKRAGVKGNVPKSGGGEMEDFGGLPKGLMK